jgi:GGDEF domain-containing protein
VTAGLPDGIGLSLGIATVPADAERLMDAIREADSRMYEAKLKDRAAQKHRA